MKQGNLYRGVLPFLLYTFLLSLWMIFGCTNPKGGRGLYDADDEALLPFAAMYQVDREQFCLTEIDKESRVKLERDKGTQGYDVMLHMYSDGVSRTVAFVQENDQYVWIGEQEVHYSGRKFMTLDGELPEDITITYYERKMFGGMIGQMITYSGDNADIPFMPTCSQALSYIEEWDARRDTLDNN